MPFAARCSTQPCNLSLDPEILPIGRQVLRALPGGGDRPDGPPEDEGGEEVPQEGGHLVQGAGPKGQLGGGRDRPCPHTIQVSNMEERWSLKSSRIGKETTPDRKMFLYY